MDLELYRSLYASLTDRDQIDRLWRLHAPQYKFSLIPTIHPSVSFESVEAIYYRRRHYEGRKAMWQMNKLRLREDQLWRE